MIRLPIGLLLFVPAMLAAAEVPPPTGEAVVAADAQWEVLYTRSAKIDGGLTEGPAVAPDGSIYFSDIPFGSHAGLIVRFDPKSKQTSIFADDSGKSNGLIFSADGYLLACEGADRGGRAITRWNVTTKQKAILADRYKGKRFNAPNDLCLDRSGRVYFSDPKYLGDEPRELEHRAVYRIEPDGVVHEVTHDVSKPNGVAISPDGKTLYVADHDNGVEDVRQATPARAGNMKVYAFKLAPDGAIVGPRKTLLDFGTKKGCNGMTVDADGRLYLTTRDASRPGVLVVDAEGKEVAFLPTGPANQKQAQPVGLPSNVEFGLGDEINVLYCTVDLSLQRMKLKSKGFHVQYQK